MSDELEARIDFLKSGPWIAAGQSAWAVIGTPPKLRGEATKKQKELKTLLRRHWDDVIYEDEGEIRDSFDEALTLYQLYELAIETNYISLDLVREEIHDDLKRLLWSKGARHYLKYYNYTAVAFLAERVGLDLGFNRMSLPSVRNGTEGRFASFLSQHVLWYSDEILDGWIGFLDDYQVLSDSDDSDKDVFESFLSTADRNFKEEATLWDFVAGADRLVARLAAVAEMLSETDKPYYGMFYAYWMAKMYGYDLGDAGFFRDGEQLDWSAELLKSKRLQHQLKRAQEKLKTSGSDDAPESPIELFAANDKIVRDFWDVTRMQFDADPIQFK